VTSANPANTEYRHWLRAGSVRVLLVIAVFFVGMSSTVWWFLQAKSADSRSKSSKGDSEDKLLVREILMDLGTCEAGGRISREIQVEKNTSSQWNILDIRSDCGCLTQTLDRGSVPPGQSALLKISLQLPTSSGQLTRRVFIKTDSQENPSVLIVVKVDVANWVTVKPDALEFDDLALPGSVVERSCEIQLLGGHEIDWERTELSLEGARYEVIPSVSSGQSSSSNSLPSQVTVRVSRKSPFVLKSGREEGFLTLVRKSDGVDYKIPCRVHERPCVAVQPSQLFFGLVTAGSSVQKDLIIQSALADIQLEKWSHDVEGKIQISEIPGAGQNQRKLRVVWKPKDAESLSGSLTLKFNNDIEFPVTVEGLSQ